LDIRFFLTDPLIALANHHVVSTGIGRVLDAADAGSKKVGGDFGYNDAQSFGPADTQTLCEQVGPVVHLLGSLHDFTFRLGMQFGGVLKGSRNSRYGHAKFFGDFLHRNLSPLFHPADFFDFTTLQSSAITNKAKIFKKIAILDK
jgi:hypothetical protein